MAVDSRFFIEHFNESIKGEYFRKPKGTVVFEAENFWIDTSYQPYYNFVWRYIRLRNQNTLKTELVEEGEFRRKWVAV